MNQLKIVITGALVSICLLSCERSKDGNNTSGYAGSSTCRPCHERFYQLWEPSHHGKAMQPFTPDFAKSELTFPGEKIAIDGINYQAVMENQTGWILESGANGRKKYQIVHVLGGKNVYYFLTPLEKGRLQVLPLGFNVREKQWYNTTESMVRHFVDVEDEALNWRETAFTFNTSCFSCHVSQLSTNYDLKTDTYATTWTEPGINCETCHGPSTEHIHVCENLSEGETAEDLKIISTSGFNHDELNSSCAPCHAKMQPISGSFIPGDDYFQHYDLVTLEDMDFYPDARDLGENYTYTLWRMNPCVKSGQMSCLHCHTSSGRFRFKGRENDACLPCHEKRVANVVAHSRHKTDSTGSKCIACHMPMTEFALMKRSDHSMLPPTPAATIAYESPNACNICHDDKDAVWAEKLVRKWFGKEYQASKLYLADLLNACRKNNWSKLDAVLDYIQSKDHDEIYTTSFIRLLAGCPDEKKWPVLLKTLQTVMKRFPSYGEAYILFGNILVSQNKRNEAIAFYRNSLNRNTLSNDVRARMARQLKSLVASH